MANFLYPPGSFIDSGSAMSDAMELKGQNLNIEKSVTPLVFPENIGSPGSFNNHFMVIDILGESSILGTANPTNAYVPIGGRESKRQLIQAEKTIILYTTNTLQYTALNDFEEVSLTSLALDTLLGPSKIRTLAETGLKVGGATVNPRTEVLFSNTKLRQFQFDFLFAPASKEETRTLDDILFELRRAAAPRKSTNMLGLLWIPPRKLQVRFYNVLDGLTQESKALPKLKPLIIDALDIDYAPDGPYSTFTNGYPVATRMQLRLREDEVIDRGFIEANDREPRGSERF